MKNIKWAILSLSIAILTFSSCIVIDDDSDFGRCLRGTGDIETMTLDLDDFSKIDLDIPAEIYLTQGDVQEIIVEGKQNIIDELNRSISGKTWKIETDRCTKNIGDMKFFITIPDIEKLKISGSGIIKSENSITTDRLELIISGSGDFDIATVASDIECNTSGSGTFYLEGETANLDFKVSGSGKLNAFDMEAINVDLKISGSGDADVRAAESLKIKIAGSGDVYYKGHPELDINITGSGEVVDAN